MKDTMMMVPKHEGYQILIQRLNSEIIRKENLRISFSEIASEICGSVSNEQYNDAVDYADNIGKHITELVLQRDSAYEEYSKWCHESGCAPRFEKDIQ